jgi:hypothetical protein
MERPLRRKNTPDRIAQSLQQRLNLYALAAGAAGAGLLAVPQALEAEVVFTPTHIRLTNGKLPIDLNHDGTVDFVLTNLSTGGSCCFYTRNLSVTGAFVGSSQNGVIGVGLNANALKPGLAIGPRQLFLFAPMRMATAFNDSNSFFYVFGAFANTTDRFLGLKFNLNGQGHPHYGWARFSMVKAGFNGSLPVISATLTGYAYETVENRAIIAGQTSGGSASLWSPSDALPAGQPASLGVLALGSRGLDVWRREDASLAR